MNCRIPVRRMSLYWVARYLQQPGNRFISFGSARCHGLFQLISCSSQILESPGNIGRETKGEAIRRSSKRSNRERELPRS